MEFELSGNHGFVLAAVIWDVLLHVSGLEVVRESCGPGMRLPLISLSIAAPEGWGAPRLTNCGLGLSLEASRLRPRTPACLPPPTFVQHFWMATMVVNARKKYQVGYPNLYAPQGELATE
jgi:hypothetical protein